MASNLDIVIRQSWGAYIAEQLPYKNVLLRSGALYVDPNTLAGRTDGNLRVPFYTNLASLLGESSKVTGTSTLSPTRLTGDYMYAPIMHREEGFAEADMEKLTQTDESGIPVLTTQIAEYVARDIDKPFRYMLTGLFGTGGILYDTHTINNAVSGITYDKINTAKWHLGEVGNTFNFIIMHTATYKALTQENSIIQLDAQQVNSNLLLTGIVPTILGMVIFQSDTICAPTDNVYPVYLGGGQPLYLGYQRDITVEPFRNVMTGGGRWEYAIRWSIATHCTGTSYGGSVNPAFTDLATVGSWTKKASDDSLIPLVRLEVGV